MTKEVRMIGYLLEDYGNLDVTNVAKKIETNGSTYLVKNAGTDTVFIGSNDSVTVDNGFPLKDGDEIFVRNDTYAIADTTGDLRYIKADK